jgi:hypothetical protein
LGEDHTTLGSHILTVSKILKMPEQVLGPIEFERLKRVEPNGWYPVEWLLGLTEILEAHVGRYGLMQLGRKLFESVHKERVLQVAKSAKDILYGLDAIYRHGNRGRGIGGWQVSKFGAGFAELEKNTPLHCLMDQGLLTEALLSVGSACNVSQKRCFLDGADVCVFEVTTAFVDQRWSG